MYNMVSVIHLTLQLGVFLFALFCVKRYYSQEKILNTITSRSTEKNADDKNAVSGIQVFFSTQNDLNLVRTCSLNASSYQNFPCVTPVSTIDTDPRLLHCDVKVTTTKLRPSNELISEYIIIVHDFNE